MQTIGSKSRRALSAALPLKRSGSAALSVFGEYVSAVLPLIKYNIAPREAKTLYHMRSFSYLCKVLLSGGLRRAPATNEENQTDIEKTT
jgi:hypothetical protein